MYGTFARSFVLEACMKSPDLENAEIFFVLLYFRTAIFYFSLLLFGYSVLCVISVFLAGLLPNDLSLT